MGTRALINIKSEGKNSHTLVSIYKQCDGYPLGLGKDIYKILNSGDVEILNGYQREDRSPEKFNGIGCLAAYLISELKTDIGDVYIASSDGVDCGEEFVYELFNKNGRICMSIQDIHAGRTVTSELKAFPQMIKTLDEEIR